MNTSLILLVAIPAVTGLLGVALTAYAHIQWDRKRLLFLRTRKARVATYLPSALCLLLWSVAVLLWKTQATLLVRAASPLSGIVNDSFFALCGGCALYVLCDRLVQASLRSGLIRSRARVPRIPYRGETMAREIVPPAPEVAAHTSPPSHDPLFRDS